jgi:hypothetical protein
MSPDSAQGKVGEKRGRILEGERGWRRRKERERERERERGEEGRRRRGEG